MADVQDEVQEELAWDLRALEAAEVLTDERAVQAGVTSPVAGFYPSLHLDLGECYRKLGDLNSAREHLCRGVAAVGALTEDGYGQLIRAGLDRPGERLTSARGETPSGAKAPREPTSAGPLSESSAADGRLGRR